MLKKIEIKGYKSIRELSLDLEPLNILIGSNGVGKSNFISFFKLINNIYEDRLQEFSLKKGVDSLLHYGRKNTSKIYGKLDLSPNIYSVTLEPSDEGALFIAEQVNEYGEEHHGQLNMKESALRSSSTQRNRYLNRYLESYKTYHFHDTSNTAPLRSPAQVNDNHSLKEDGRNLPAYLYYLQEKHPKTFNRIEKTIRSTVPFFDRFDLKPSQHNKDSIQLVWLEKQYPDSYFDATHLSDGSLRFIALTTLLLQPELPKIIIIDEPELGLHPFAINKLSGLLQSVVARGCQVIVSTQSVNLLNNFEPNNIITVDKEDNQSVFNRLNEDDLKNWLDDYSVGDLWIKSVIKGQPL